MLQMIDKNLICCSLLAPTFGSLAPAFLSSLFFLFPLVFFLNEYRYLFVIAAARLLLSYRLLFLFELAHHPPRVGLLFSFP